MTEVPSAEDASRTTGAKSAGTAGRKRKRSEVHPQGDDAALPSIHHTERSPCRPRLEDEVSDYPAHPSVLSGVRLSDGNRVFITSGLPPVPVAQFVAQEESEADPATAAFESMTDRLDPIPKGGAAFRYHCARRLRMAIGTSPAKAAAPAIVFDELPVCVFDSLTIGMNELVRARPTTAGHQIRLDIVAAFIDIARGAFADHPPQLLDIRDRLRFGSDLRRALSPNGCFSIWIQAFDAESRELLTEAVSPVAVLLHDALQDRPYELTADMLFFPLRVLARHAGNNCSSSMVSKRNRALRLRSIPEQSLLSSSERCEGNGAADAGTHQLYPSRKIRKELHLLCDRIDAQQRARKRAAQQEEGVGSTDSTPPVPCDASNIENDILALSADRRVRAAAIELYKRAAQPVREQTDRFWTHGPFLKERGRRWELFSEIVTVDAYTPTLGEDVHEAVARLRMALDAFPFPRTDATSQTAGPG